MWPFSPVVIVTFLKRKRPGVNIFTVFGVNRALNVFQTGLQEF